MNLLTDTGDIFARIIGNKEDYQINYSKNTTTAKEKQITAVSNKGKVEISFIQNSKKRRDGFYKSISLQAVDKCRNCMSQQPVLMRKSAKNVII